MFCLLQSRCLNSLNGAFFPSSTTLRNGKNWFAELFFAFKNCLELSAGSLDWFFTLILSKILHCTWCVWCNKKCRTGRKKCDDDSVYDFVTRRFGRSVWLVLTFSSNVEKSFEAGLFKTPNRLISLSQFLTDNCGISESLEVSKFDAQLLMANLYSIWIVCLNDFIVYAFSSRKKTNLAWSKGVKIWLFFTVKSQTSQSIHSFGEYYHN